MFASQLNILNGQGINIRAQGALSNPALEISVDNDYIENYISGFTNPFGSDYASISNMAKGMGLLESSINNIVNTANDSRTLSEDKVKSVITSIETGLCKLDRRIIRSMYGCMNGYIIIFQGFALSSVQTDIEYAGETVRLTIINSIGTITSNVEIDSQGLMPIEEFTLNTGYNIIFCETDPTQTIGNQIAGSTVIPLHVVYARPYMRFAEESFDTFLASQSLRRQYTLLDPIPAEPDPNERYFIKLHCDNEAIWEDIGTTDGDYYVSISSIEDANGQNVYTESFVRVSA